MKSNSLRGHRILVVEDDAILAMSYEDLLRDAGADVLGPAATLASANALALQDGISAALLDIRLNGDEVWPVARLLTTKMVPFVFCTGHYDQDTLPPDMSARLILSKPTRPRELIAALAGLVKARL